MAGQPTTLHPTSLGPRHVTRVVGPNGTQVTMLLPAGVTSLLNEFFPGHTSMFVERHSDQVYSFGMLDPDYRYTVWRASLSLDQRWTLSPVDGPWQGRPVIVSD